MTEDHRKVLIVAYYFPPLGLSGVQRTAKFAKYLKRYGWEPTVLTVEPGAYYAYDESMLREVEAAGVRIVRTSSRDVNRLLRKRKIVRPPSERIRKVLAYISDFLFIPDSKRGWKSKAVKAASALLSKERFDVILATAPPQTDFLIGAELEKRFGTGLVLDYRDSWLEYPFKNFPTPLHRWWHKRLERRVLKAADRVIVTHRLVKETLLKRYRQLTYHDVVIIPHGYDVEDFEGADIPPSRPRGPLTITHAGTFYGRRSPAVLFRALANLRAADSSFRDSVRIHIVGNTRKEDERLAEKLGITDAVVFHGYLEHRSCVRQLLRSDVLWYMLDHDILSPGKLYEYFGCRKTILGSVVEGYTRQLLVESGAAVCVGLTDVKAHEAALKELVRALGEGKLPRVGEEFAKKFDRLLLTGDLAKQMESLIDIDRHAFVKVQEARS